MYETVLSNSIQQLSDYTLLFAFDHKWPTGIARTHTDVSVKWPNTGDDSDVILCRSALPPPFGGIYYVAV